MIRFEDIIEKVERNYPAADLDPLKRAYILSAKVHRGQLRRSGEPYMVHPLEVANVLADWGLDGTSVAVGLLHDVVEDTLTTLADLEDLFGADVAHLVDGVTKISKIAFTSTEEQQAENFRKMLLAMVDDIRVILVKLADRLHNMRTLEHLSRSQQLRIAGETMDIYAPIANRLGMGKLKSEMEDLSFRHLEPERYRELEQRMDERRQISDELIEKVSDRIGSAISEAGIEGEISGRVKRIYSIYRKIKAQAIGVDEIYDYIAFRMLVPEVRDCYAALGIIHQIWSPVPGRIKDYVAMPKPNGYRSLHTSVVGFKGQPFEVQIRTPEMHLVAEDGIAAHWKYKEGGAVGAREEEAVKWLRRLVESSREIKEPRAFLAALKIDLYPDEVYTFTPKGEVRCFPRGATPIDFAYAVHTEIGHRCVGAKVNGSLVPLKTPLKNGDIVEILTATKHSPSRDWLACVKTSRAASKIKQWLRAEARGKSIELGKRILEKELRKHHGSIKNVSRHGDLDRILSSLGLAGLDDLFAAVGYGKVTAQQVAQKLLPPGEVMPRPARSDDSAAAAAATESQILVRGLDDMLVALARCCRPVKGEPIVGYITRGKGISVHADSCPNVDRLLLDAGRRIDVEWATSDGASYAAKLLITTQDRKGILAKVTATIAALETNIKNIEARVKGVHGAIDVVIDVQDVWHLRKVIDAITHVDGVERVERTAGTEMGPERAPLPRNVGAH